MKKKCIKCNQIKLSNCFYKSTYKDGMQRWCKPCAFEYGKSLDTHFRNCFTSSIKRAEKFNREHTLTWEEWLTFKPKYSELHKEWVESGYKRSLTPSIDRIDSSQGYTSSNVQVITFGENAGKDQRGERHHSAKLTDHDVIAIRALKKVNPRLSQRKLAKMFNTGQATIWFVLNKKTWAHLSKLNL